MATSFYGWMASCTPTKPDPSDLHQPRLSTLADCFTERPGSSSASPLPYIKSGLFSLFKVQLSSLIFPFLPGSSLSSF